MTRNVDVAIIGAGTAGLTAQEQVVQKTDNFVIIDDGPLGTTCARVGCMPSKDLIAVADDLHKCSFFEDYGISGARNLTVNLPHVMARVRRLRDSYAGGVIEDMAGFMDKVIRKRARFIDSNTLDLGDETIRAKCIIIATGSKPWIPDQWRPFQDAILDTDRFFELETLPSSVAVFGLGPIGIELGQALHRLGVEVTAITRRKTAGGLTDPDMQTYAFTHFSNEMDIQVGQADILGRDGQQIRVGWGAGEKSVDMILLATGRRPAVRDLGLENLGLELDERGLPAFDPGTLQVKDRPVFIAGDVNGLKPILHEAADDGAVAGFNATAENSTCFKKRMGLHITFSSPNIAVAGMSHAELTRRHIDFVVGKASWEHLGRARMMLGRAAGIARIYAATADGRLLGAELMAPGGEHMAHLLSWAMANGMTAADALTMPIYHPVPEEALSSAFWQIIRQTRISAPAFGLLPCQS